MSDGQHYLRMTIDVVVFEKSEKLAHKLLNDGEDGSVLPTQDGKGVAVRRFWPWGTGEALARKVGEAISFGYIEIDEVRDVEDHT